MLSYHLDQWREVRVGGINHESSDYGATDTVMRWAVLVVYASVFGTKTTTLFPESSIDGCKETVGCARG